MDPENLLDPAETGTDPNAGEGGAPAAFEITDDVRNQVLSEAVARGDFVPAWMLQTEPGQPQTREAPPANVKPTWESCDCDSVRFTEELANYYERQAHEREADLEKRIVERFGPAIAEGRTASMVSNVSGIAPAARPYLEQIIKNAGPEAATWTPAQRVIVENAALGQALREGKLSTPGRGGYQPEPTGTRIPDVVYGADPYTGVAYDRETETAMSQLFGRQMSPEELKAAGVRR